MVSSLQRSNAFDLYILTGAHRILWTREHVTPYTTNIMGEIQTWHPNTNNSIIQIRKISMLLSVTSSL